MPCVNSHIQGHSVLQHHWIKMPNPDVFGVACLHFSTSAKRHVANAVVDVLSSPRAGGKNNNEIQRHHSLCFLGEQWMLTVSDFSLG